MLAMKPIDQNKTISQSSIAKTLGLWDSVSIIVGIVVGIAIFRPTLVFQNVAGPWQALAAWLFGGFLCLIGALCYAELATTYPRNGGDDLIDHLDPSSSFELDIGGEG